MWPFTVASERLRSEAITLFELPWATRCRMATSRSVSASPLMCSASSRATSGGIQRRPALTGADACTSSALRGVFFSRYPDAPAFSARMASTSPWLGVLSGTMKRAFEEFGADGLHGVDLPADCPASVHRTVQRDVRGDGLRDDWMASAPVDVASATSLMSSSPAITAAMPSRSRG